VTSLVDRGDVFDADVAEAGHHPVVVVSRQSAIAVRSNVTVVLVTSVVRGHRAEVALGPEHGLEHESVANCDEVHTVQKARLTRRRGSVGLERMRAIEDGLRLSLDL
jgi:mRNA interferase MazF